MSFVNLSFSADNVCAFAFKTSYALTCFCNEFSFSFTKPFAASILYCACFLSSFNFLTSFFKFSIVVFNSFSDACNVLICAFNFLISSSRLFTSFCNWDEDALAVCFNFATAAVSAASDDSRFLIFFFNSTISASRASIVLTLASIVLTFATISSFAVDNAALLTFASDCASFFFRLHCFNSSDRSLFSFFKRLISSCNFVNCFSLPDWPAANCDSLYLIAFNSFFKAAISFSNSVIRVFFVACAAFSFL